MAGARPPAASFPARAKRMCRGVTIVLQCVTDDATPGAHSWRRRAAVDEMMVTYEQWWFMNERRLAEDEKPLLVQLNWNKDDREGRFLLRRMDLYNSIGSLHHSNHSMVHTLPPHPTTPVPSKEQPFQRKLSKREKKELKKQEKLRRANEANENDSSVAEKLYTGRAIIVIPNLAELPETSFTRSISNPEAVMRRRRAQKLEKKLQQFRSKDGGPDTGGTLKIYGESLRPDVPYKTLLLSVRDNALTVVREMLDKYGLHREDPANYCLMQTVIGNDDGYGRAMSPQKEYILDDDECPLAILMNHPPSRGECSVDIENIVSKTFPENICMLR
ncbi:Afadin [Portunus trituberculatus]|uniref:Afadin n=1 Tax=Portunus trituberculatus TaxID=210409 RepID=A0A5B7F8T5_PORTR|nr:Afadin [Portunus trituberculatus]